MIQPTLVNLHPNEYSQEFHYYPYMVKLDRWAGSCDTIMAYLIKYVFQIQHISMFNMITAINESKTLTKHILWEYSCRFDGRKCNSDQWWNNNKC